MLEIDGGDGGGQVVRTAVTLSALSGRAVTVGDVRGARSTPGMRPQHVAAVEAAAALCSATVEGATTGADALVFDPGPLRADDVAVDVGTAGSVPLVFDTVLPLAAALAEPATVTATGGTDVEWSPPVDYLRRVKLPLLSMAGLEADLSVDGRGFYPVGGGEATLSLSPSSRRSATTPASRPATTTSCYRPDEGPGRYPRTRPARPTPCGGTAGRRGRRHRYTTGSVRNPP